MDTCRFRVVKLVLGLTVALAPGVLGAEGGGAAPLPLPFNGDLCADLAIGVPDADVPGAYTAGAVNVLHGGSPDGLTAIGSQLWDQSVLVSDGPEFMDEFGYSVAVGDFNGDGFVDLAIGVRQEGIGVVDDAGAVHAVYGSAAGLTADGNQLWTQEDLGGVSATADYFGLAVAAGDFNGDGFADLAVGAPYVNPGGVSNAGVVRVVYGWVNGLMAAGNQLWRQGAAGVPGVAEAGDYFGWALAVGDFNGDGYADLAVGAPLDDLDIADEGIVHVLYGSASGLTATGTTFWTVEALGQGLSPGGDFGQALAAADFNGDGADDLAVSAPTREVGSVTDAGVVFLIYGSDAGLVSTGHQVWSQNTPGVGGMSEVDDHFGGALAAGDLDGDRYADLAIGVPDEDLTVANAGCVNVLYGSASGLQAGAELWHQDSTGILDAAEVDDAFGYALAIGDFDGDGYGDLAVGVPQEHVDSAVYSLGAVNVLYGSQVGLSATGNQLWHQEVAGVPGEGGGMFGLALASVPASRAFLFADDLERGDTSAWSATTP